MIVVRFAVAGYLEHMIVLIIILRRPGRDAGAPDNITTAHTCGLGELCAMCHPHGSKLTSKLGRAPLPAHGPKSTSKLGRAPLPAPRLNIVSERPYRKFAITANDRHGNVKSGQGGAPIEVNFDPGWSVSVIII